MNTPITAKAAPATIAYVFLENIQYNIFPIVKEYIKKPIIPSSASKEKNKLLALDCPIPTPITGLVKNASQDQRFHVDLVE